MKPFIAATLPLFLALVPLSGPANALPGGYDRVFAPLTHSESGVFTFDPAGNLYYGHPSGGKNSRSPRSGESRAASNQIWKYHPSTAQSSLFYQSPATGPGEPGINSASAVVIDDSVVPWIYYIADQEPVKGSYYTTGAIWRCHEASGMEDGDLLDASDTVELYTDQDAVVFIEGLIRNSATGEMFASNGEGAQGSVMVYRIYDGSLNGHIEPSEITPFFLEPVDYAFAGKVALRASDPQAIYTVDTSGTIYRLEDLNADHDCLDPLEVAAAPYASIPDQGGYDLEFDPEDDLFVTGSDYMQNSHRLYIVPSGSTTADVFDDLSGFAGWSGTICFGPGSSFNPGIPGAGMYMNYSTLLYGDPDNFAVYTGRLYDVPATGTWAISVILAVMGWMVSFRLKKK